MICKNCNGDGYIKVCEHKTTNGSVKCTHCNGTCIEPQETNYIIALKIFREEYWPNKPKEVMGLNGGVNRKSTKHLIKEIFTVSAEYFKMTNSKKLEGLKILRDWVDNEFMQIEGT